MQLGNDTFVLRRSACGLASPREAWSCRAWMGSPGDILIQRSFMSTAKQDVESLLHKLPEDSSVEDIQYHLYVLDKVRRGLEDARINGTLSQEEVEARLTKWLTE